MQAGFYHQSKRPTLKAITKKEITMWKQITYNNMLIPYEASDEGQIRNANTLKILSGRPNKASGYVQYSLQINGAHRTILGHRLILSTFQPIDNEGEMTVNHKDGDKTNNKLSNLEWMTMQENILHAWHTGLNYPHILRKVEQYSTNGDFIASYDSIADAIRTTGVVKVREAANGERKTAGGFIWKWVEEFTPEDRGAKKPVLQFDLVGNYIQEYESVSAAARATGSNRKGISAVCLGKGKSCNNFIWRFK